MKLAAKVAVLLSVSEAVSVNNTPPVNEIYEEVLRNRFENRDNKERLLLEMTDLNDELAAADKEQSENLKKLRSELDQMKKDISKKSDQVSSLKDSKKKLSNSVEGIKTDFSERLTKLEEEYTAQQTGMVLDL